MSCEPLTLEAEAQQVLNELWSERLIPFALNVRKITRAIGEFTIHFHDRRIHSARVPLAKGQSFRDMVQSSVLARVGEISGPLKTDLAKLKANQSLS